MSPQGSVSGDILPSLPLLGREMDTMPELHCILVTARSGLLFFLRLIKVVVLSCLGLQVLLCSVATLPICSCTKLKKARGGSPCSGFSSLFFPLELMKTSLTTVQTEATNEITSSKGGSSGHEI